MAEEFVIVGWMDYGVNRDAVLAAFLECARASREEAGCLDYWVTADAENAGRLYVFERWVSEEALAEHFGTPHIETFRDAVADYPRSGRELRRYFVSRGEEFSTSRPTVS